jgi:hypothetical protein
VNHLQATGLTFRFLPGLVQAGAPQVAEFDPGGRAWNDRQSGYLTEGQFVGAKRDHISDQQKGTSQNGNVQNFGSLEGIDSREPC